MLALVLAHWFAQNERMRVKVYELRPSPSGFVLDEDRLHCIIDIQNGNGAFRFFNASREKLIRSLFSGPSSRFVAGGKSPDGTYFDAMETHPTWSAEAIESIVKHQLYGHSLGGTIDYDS